MNEIAKSPTPAQVEESPTEKPEQLQEMSFFDALKTVVKDGSRIHKIEWGNRDYYGELKDGILKLHKPDGSWYDWILSDGDLTGEDWIILN